VAAKHENLHEWLDTYPEERWVYSHDSVRAMQDVMHDFSVGTNANKLGKTIRKKLGDDFRAVSRQLVHFLAKKKISRSFLNSVVIDSIALAAKSRYKSCSLQKSKPWPNHGQNFSLRTISGKRPRHMQTHFGGDHTDVVYIPARLAGDFIVAAYAFREKATMYEIAVPAIFGIITEDESDFEVWNDDDDDEFCASLTAILSSQKKELENRGHVPSLSFPLVQTQPLWHWYLGEPHPSLPS
jgi:hypothetical protein